MTFLANLITVQHIDPRRYQKILDFYKVYYLYWYSKDLDAIEKHLALIDQLWGLTKTPTTMASVAFRSVDYRR